jgi:hypothetical protein
MKTKLVRKLGAPQVKATTQPQLKSLVPATVGTGVSGFTSNYLKQYPAWVGLIGANAAVTFMSGFSGSALAASLGFAAFGIAFPPLFKEKFPMLFWTLTVLLYIVVIMTLLTKL